MYIIEVMDVLESLECLYDNVIHFVLAEILSSFLPMVPNLLPQIAIFAVFQNHYIFIIAIFHRNIVHFDYIFMTLPRQETLPLNLIIAPSRLLHKDLRHEKGSVRGGGRVLGLGLVLSGRRTGGCSRLLHLPHMTILDSVIRILQPNFQGVCEGAVAQLFFYMEDVLENVIGP